MPHLDPVTIALLLAVLVGSFAFVLGALPFIIDLANRADLVDRPGKRSESATAPGAQRTVANLGGVAVAGGTAFGLAIAGVFQLFSPHPTPTTSIGQSVIALVLGALVMLWVGFRDDLGKAADRRQACKLAQVASSKSAIKSRELSGRAKMAWQLLVAGFCCALGFQVQNVEFLPGQVFELGLFTWPVTMLWIVGMINAVNLLDGMDGLAGGVATIISTALGVIALSSGAVLLGVVCLALAAACAGFVRHNFEPARVYLGDTGSLFLGTMLVGLGILTSFASHGSNTLSWQFALVFALPVLDTTQVMVRRLWRGENVMVGDHKHVHHLLREQLGLAPRVASPILWLFVALTCLPALDYASSMAMRLV